MGVLGTGLYAGDFAMDLRSAIGAVARLPFEPDRLVEILCETEPAAASDAQDSDHTVFWLVVADQFARRGIVSEKAREAGLRMIDSGSDLAMQASLGMDVAGMKQRRKVLDEVRARLLAPAVFKRRNVLKKPQAWLLEIGDVILYPTFQGRCINPYFASKAKITHWVDGRVAHWEQDGWSALVLIERGRAFDFLSWYRVVTIPEALKGKPLVSALRDRQVWRLARPGTLSAMHVKRMEFEKIGTLPVDEAKVRAAFPGQRPGISYAISDISLANAISVAAPVVRSGKPDPTIAGINSICSY